MRFARTTFLLLFLTASASAETFEQSTFLRIPEEPMSARTAAMGGAADALGDDGSDLVSNPAFLASLRRPVFSLSAAQTSFDVLRVEFSENTIAFRNETRQVSALAHVSAVVPLRGAVLGLYYRDQPRLRDGEEVPAAGTEPYTPACTGPSCEYATSILPSGFERRERRYGVTAAFERGALSFGAGAELRDLDESVSSTRILFPLMLFREEHVVRRTSGTKIVPNAGIRWRVSPHWAFGAAYHGRATFDFTEDVCETTFLSAGCITQYERLEERAARTADAYRATLSVAPLRSVVITAEAVRRNFGDLDSEGPDGFELRPRYRNTTELHAGAEVRLPGIPVSLRAGWWRDPSRIEGEDFFNPPHETLDHITFGAGIDVGGARVDLAYEDADAPATRRAIVAVTLTR